MNAQDKKKKKKKISGRIPRNCYSFLLFFIVLILQNPVRSPSSPTSEVQIFFGNTSPPNNICTPLPVLFLFLFNSCLFNFFCPYTYIFSPFCICPVDFCTHPSFSSFIGVCVCVTELNGIEVYCTF